MSTNHWISRINSSNRMKSRLRSAENLLESNHAVVFGVFPSKQNIKPPRLDRDDLRPRGTYDDIQGRRCKLSGTASTSGQLRAQRLGSGTGRVYTFAYTGAERAGKTASCVTTVTVLHDQGHLNSEHLTRRAEPYGAMPDPRFCMG